MLLYFWCCSHVPSQHLRISSDPPNTWSPYSSSQDENQSKCASPSEDDFHLNAHLMRFASNTRGERVPLSTLQLLGETAPDVLKSQ